MRKVTVRKGIVNVMAMGTCVANIANASTVTIVASIWKIDRSNPIGKLSLEIIGSEFNREWEEGEEGDPCIIIMVLYLLIYD